MFVLLCPSNRISQWVLSSLGARVDRLAGVTGHQHAWGLRDDLLCRWTVPARTVLSRVGGVRNLERRAHSTEDYGGESPVRQQ